MSKVDTSKTTSTTNSRKYYGVESVEKFADGVTNNKIFILANMLLIIMSSIVMISLNITNLENLNNQKTSLKILNDDVNNKLEQIDTLDQIVKGEIKPKLTLVNSAVSVTIPSQLSNLATKLNNQIKTLEVAVNKQCSGNILGGLLTPKPPEGGDVINPDDNSTGDNTDDLEGDMRPLNLAQLNDCSNYPQAPQPTFAIDPDLHPMPELTEPIQLKNHCAVFPTVALGESIYVYSHQIRKTPCKSEDTIHQRVSIGRIVDRGFSGPRASPLSTWDLQETGYLSSCSVAASGETGWVLCVTTDKFTGATVYLGPYTGLKLYKLSVRGQKEEYAITANDITSDATLIALTLTRGSGVSKNNKLIFLGIAAVRDADRTGVLCPDWKCDNINNNINSCVHSYRLTSDNNNYFMNVVVTVDVSPAGKMIASVSLLPMSESYIGSEGSVIDKPGGYGLMISNKGWFARIRYGQTERTSPQRYDWTDYMSFETPYYLYCSGGRICPSSCRTWNFTVPTILNPSGEIIIGVKAKSRTGNSMSMISINTPNEVIDQYEVFTDYLSIGSTITKCFLYKRQPWCLVLLEGVPKSTGLTETSIQTFRIYKSCVKSRTYLDSLGSRYYYVSDQGGNRTRQAYKLTSDT
ncbi:attachment glycoprotein [Wufeng Crocidura attenuata henipavirus 1]|nr:attachment glycoprotein [Wufeng Crocidura attenuata henipavirus 1]